jgi:23S rRNA pseudouridine2604 synthase
MTTLKINKSVKKTDTATRTPIRGRNRNNHVATPVVDPKSAPRGEKSNRSFDKKTSRDSDKPRDFGNRPARPFNDKPRSAESARGNEPNRSFADKPAHSTPKPHNKSNPTRNNHSSNPWGKPRTEPSTDANPWGKTTASRPARVDDGKVRTGKPVDRSNNPYAPTPSNKKNQEPRRHGKLRDEDGRPIRVVAPRLAPLDAGIRLSKQLSDQGLCSRREADEFIEKGWVTVNGERATLGQRVLPSDRVQVAKQAERAIESRVTILINKPVGLVSGQAEDGYAPAVSLVTPENQWINDVAQISFEHKHLRGLAPAGRLDIDSVGLLVLTQDGRVAKALIGDKSDVDKEYLVRVEGELSAEGLKLLNHGLELDGVPLRKAKVTWQNEDQLRFVLTEGKKRQIRRMCELVGLNVVGLKRIRIGKVALGDLPTGMWRYLGEDEAF